MLTRCKKSVKRSRWWDIECAEVCSSGPHIGNSARVNEDATARLIRELHAEVETLKQLQNSASAADDVVSQSHLEVAWLGRQLMTKEAEMNEMKSAWLEKMQRISGREPTGDCRHWLYPWRSSCRSLDDRRRRMPRRPSCCVEFSLLSVTVCWQQGCSHRDSWSMLDICQWKWIDWHLPTSPRWTMYNVCPDSDSDNSRDF